MSERNCVTHHICDCQQAKMDELRAELQAAREALSYYANEKNWYDVNKGKRDAPEIRMVIGSIDTEGDQWIGGFQARKALTRIDDFLDGKTKLGQGLLRGMREAVESEK